MLGTNGRLLVHSWAYSSLSRAPSLSLASTLSALSLLFDRLLRLATALGRLSDLGAPTCFTDAADIGGAPLFGGIGGFDDELRR